MFGVQVSPFSRHVHILARGHNNYQDTAGGQTLITLKCKFSITPNNLSLPSLPTTHSTHVATVIRGAIITGNDDNGDNE